MTAAESLAVVQAHPVRYQPLMAFLRGTGARFGEATALLGRDFQLEVQQPTVRIEKAWKRDADDRFYVGPPKTKKSRRTVSLSPSLVALVRHAVEQPARTAWCLRQPTAAQSGTPRSTNSGRTL